MVPSSGGDGDIYGNDRRNKAHEALYFAHNSFSAVYDILVEEGVEKRRLPRVYYIHRVVCLD